MNQYLSFLVGAEQLGLGILESREILQYPTVTSVPSMSSSIRGVINLRGTAVPVVDLAMVFGQEPQQITKRTCVVVVENEESKLVGLIVESVHQVFELRPEDIEPPPTLGSRGRMKLVRGLARTADAFVLLLDLPRVFEQIELDEVLEEISMEADEPPVETFEEVQP